MINVLQVISAVCVEILDLKGLEIAVNEDGILCCDFC